MVVVRMGRWMRDCRVRVNSGMIHATECAEEWWKYVGEFVIGSSVRVGRLTALLCGGFVASLVVGLALLPRVLSSAIVCVKCGWLVGCLFRLVSLCVVAWNSPSIPLFSLPVFCCYFFCFFCFCFCFFLPLLSLSLCVSLCLLVLLLANIPFLLNEQKTQRTYAVLRTNYCLLFVVYVRVSEYLQ